ncbi:MAG: hypothetical protein EXR12_04620 [Rhodospirillaceae bacterium]|nr:hypothetical protein [Rhodospirillaceae bacterium]
MVVPIGGTVGGMIGAMEGGVSWHTCGAQIGGRSMLLSQIGCTSPFTQRQTQRASAEAMKATTRQNAKIPDVQGIVLMVRDFLIRILLQEKNMPAVVYRP